MRDKQMVQGRSYRGILKYDVTIDDFLNDEHFTFTEIPPSTDGKLPRFTGDYTFKDFCREASRELAQLPCLIEEETEAEK